LISPFSRIPAFVVYVQYIFLLTLLKLWGVFPTHIALQFNNRAVVSAFYCSYADFESTQWKKTGKVLKYMLSRCSWNMFAHVLGECYFQKLCRFGQCKFDKSVSKRKNKDLCSHCTM
jgi:hypothetical protein